MDRMLSWVLKRGVLQDVRACSSESRSSSTWRAMERLTSRRCGWPCRLREALITGCGGVALEQQDGAALGGHGLEQQVEDLLEQLRQRPVREQLARAPR